jgi:hypothetical protein
MIKLTMKIIRIIHSLIWVIMVFSIFYIIYAGIVNRLDIYLWMNIGLMIFELIVLAINKGSCPLTIVAKKIKKEYKDGDDIFLPKWVAINNKLIFGPLLFIGFLIILYRILG